MAKMAGGPKPSPLVTAASVTREAIAVGLLGRKKVAAPGAAGGGGEADAEEWRDGLLATLLRPLHEARSRRLAAEGQAEPRAQTASPADAGSGGEQAGLSPVKEVASPAAPGAEAPSGAKPTPGEVPSAGGSESNAAAASDAGGAPGGGSNDGGGGGGGGEDGGGNEPPMWLVFDGHIEPLLTLTPNPSPGPSPSPRLSPYPSPNPYPNANANANPNPNPNPSPKPNTGELSPPLCEALSGMVAAAGGDGGARRLHLESGERLRLPAVSRRTFTP
jgi:hypothetical protein